MTKMCSFGELDAHLFNKGCHYKLYEVMGAHVAVKEAAIILFPIVNMTVFFDQGRRA